MYGDTTVIRRLADRMGEQAEDIRAEARDLMARAESVSWHGRAADAMRRRAGDRAGQLNRTARSHDDAAEALRAHAREVDQLKELIASLERRARGLVRSVPLPSGHKDWLDSSLPGLG